MFRKLLAVLLINGLVVQPVQQVVQPLYASEPPVRLASLASEPASEPESPGMAQPEMPEALPEAIQVEEIDDAPLLAFESVGELGLSVSVAFADSATPSAATSRWAT